MAYKFFKMARKIWRDPNLTSGEKVWLGRIADYAYMVERDGERYCDVSNRVQARDAGTSVTTVKKYHNRLEEKGKIHREYEGRQAGGRKRKIYLSEEYPSLVENGNGDDPKAPAGSAAEELPF